MSPSLIGGIAGLALGLAAWAVCQSAASRIESSPSGSKRPGAAKQLRAAGFVLLVMDTIIGYMVGPLVLGA